MNNRLESQDARYFRLAAETQIFKYQTGKDVSAILMGNRQTEIAYDESDGSDDDSEVNRSNTVESK